MSVSAKMDRGEDCLFSSQAIVLSDCSAELVCNPALSSRGPKSFAVDMQRLADVG